MKKKDKLAGDSTHGKNQKKQPLAVSDASEISAKAGQTRAGAVDAGSADKPVYVEVASNEATRDVNRDILLERIRALQPISRVDLARASGLQPSTVSAIVEQLLEEGWVREGALLKTARGRRPTMLSLNDDLVFLVADVRPSWAVVALVNLNGHFLERQLLPLGRDAERSMAAIADVMQTYREMHASKRFEGVGLSMPGRVNPATNELLMAPHLRWSRFGICEYLTSRLNLEVQLENSANACLLSELWFGQAAGLRDAMLVSVSEGVGVAMLAGGRLLHGEHGMAGEFGHMCVNPAGPRCKCGAVGCWEVYSSSRAALRYFAELSPETECLTMVDLMALAIDGEPAARKALEMQAQAIGQGLHLLNAVLSPEVILLSGDFTAAYELYREILETECRIGSMDGTGPRLLSIGDGEMSRLRGAAAVVLQRHSGYYRSMHQRREFGPGDAETA